MMNLCPFCGHGLSRPLIDGIARCTTCSRVFDSTPLNRLLSAGWLVRRRGLDDVEDLCGAGFRADEAETAVRLVADQGLTPDEYRQALLDGGVPQSYQAAG